MDDESHRLDDLAATAGLLGLASPSDEARALLAEGQTPRALLSRLAEAGLFPDAVKLLALAMPRRQAVWWACLCCRDAATPDEPSAAVSALEAAEGWVAEPTEERRRLAQAAAEAAGLEAPGGCAAMGAFFSGGSLAPPGVPDVPPAPHLTAHVVAGAVMLGAVRSEPEKAPEKSRAALARGLAVADGSEPLPATAPASRAPAATAPGPAPGTTRVVPEPSRADRWDEEPTRPPTSGAPTRSPAPAPPRTRRWDEWE